MKDSIHSPYANAVLLDYKDGTKSLEKVEENILIDGSEPIHTVLQEETIFSIAFQYYGDSGLWYKICEVNNIENPFDDILEGMQLIIPKS